MAQKLSSSLGRVIVVGGGLIGLSLARELADHGEVTVFDLPRPTAASKVGAGLLLPVGGRISKHHFRLKKASAELYPDFVAKLEAETGSSCGYEANGTLTVAYEPKAVPAIDGLASCVAGFGVDLQRLSGQECREKEPQFCQEVGAGFLTADAQIDPIALKENLEMACRSRGVCFRENEVVSVSDRSVVTENGKEFQADTVVVASGAWIAQLLELPVFPVKGEVIETRAAPGFIKHNLIVQRESLYVANRGDGRLVIGSTEEEVGFCERQTSADLLFQKACRLLPKLREARIEVQKVGFRPKVGDGLPILGSYKGVFVAGAHYRNGILLTPITSQLMVEYILKGEPGHLMSPYLPSRAFLER